MPQLVIGIAGKARHGKTTVGQKINEFFLAKNYSTFQRTVSDEVLAECHEKGDIHSSYAREKLNEPQLAKLIRRGQSRRAEDESYWLRKLSKSWLAINTTGVFVVNGLRFPNELAWVKAAGGVTIHVTRRNADGSPFVSPDRAATDDMETSLDDYYDYDYEIAHRTGQEKWLGLAARALAESLL